MPAVGTHDVSLVILSIVIAIVASYTALDLAGRVRVTQGGARLGWLATAALAMGGGIWSMHFVAMLAFSVPGMEVGYQAGLTAASLVVAIAATGAGFLIMAQAKTARFGVLVASGLVTGLGVAAMHYMGMAAMRMHADLEYDRIWVAISILIAVGAATVALFLTGRNNRPRERLAAAVVMGVAIAGMHYAAMRGSVFRMEHGMDMIAKTVGLDQAKLAAGVAGSTLLILLLSLLAAMFDRRYAETQTRLQHDLSTAYDRQSLMLRLGDRMRLLEGAQQIMAEVASALGLFIGADRVGFYRVLADGTIDFDAGACWTDDLPALQGRRAPAVARTGTSVGGSRSSALDSSEPQGSIEEDAAVGASIGVAHVENGTCRGGLYCHRSASKPWPPESIALVEEVAGQAWDAIRRTDAREDLQRLNEHLEDRVEQQTRDIRLITDALPVLIAFVDGNLTYRFANRAYEDWFYLKPDEVVGRRIPDITGPEQFELRRKHFDGVLAGHDARFELSWPHRDGRDRIAEIRYLPRRQPDGTVDGFYIFVLDITERVEAEKRLRAANDLLEREARVQAQLAEELGRRTVEAEAANRAKSTFIANMSHELRTPLSAIIGYAEMISEEIEDGTSASDLARDVGKIEVNARHLLGLINDVLDLSKVESGKMEAFSEPIDLRAMIVDIGETVTPLIGKKGNHFQVELGVSGGEELGMITSDVTRLRQILLNLLSNAAKFTENGTVTLSVSRHEEGVRFAVSDTGIGMTPDQLSLLFQRFQQADASTTRQFGGTGLGLALTKAFVDLLEGKVEVASIHGEGTTFTVTLPLRFRENTSSYPGLTETRPEDGAADNAILVIDDDQTQRDLTSRFLVREGFAAHIAGDGATGLALARKLKPRAILLDVTMPGMDGWSVLSRLKAEPELASIPVVMVTFHSERGLAASLGATDYVMKPVDWNRLRHVMAGFRKNEGEVLVVDDEDDMRDLVRQALQKNGWQVVEAANGIEGLDAVMRSIPSVILLDLNMPLMDGFEFLQELRLRSGCENLPVVVLTARNLTDEDRRRLRGANQILNKGDLRLADLVERLSQLGLDERPS